MSKYAKAIAAALTPVVLALAAELSEAIGVDVPLDPTKTETVIVSIVGAVIVWATRNKPTY